MQMTHSCDPDDVEGISKLSSGVPGMLMRFIGSKSVSWRVPLAGCAERGEAVAARE